MIWYLWDNQTIFVKFIDEFIIQQCADAFKTNNYRKAKDLLQMVAQNMFFDPTSQTPDWRVVEIS